MQFKLYKYLCILIIVIVSYKVPTKSNILSLFHIMDNFYTKQPKLKKKLCDQSQVD